MMTDLGPYLAYYTHGRRVFLNGEKDFYTDAVPWCIDGRTFLANDRVALVVSKESPAKIASTLDLLPVDYDRDASTTTMLSLHLRDRSAAESVASTRAFATPAILGRELAVERIETAKRRGRSCGDVKVGVFGHISRPIAAGDEVFVHAFDADHTDTHFDVDTIGGPLRATGDRVEIHFLVRLPSMLEARRIELRIGLWNEYSGDRLALDAQGAPHDDEERLKITLEP